MKMLAGQQIKQPINKEKIKNLHFPLDFFISILNTSKIMDYHFIHSVGNWLKIIKMVFSDMRTSTEVGYTHKSREETKRRKSRKLK